MSDYFKRLKHHPGFGYGIFFPALGMFAGMGNKNLVWWQGGLFGFFTMAFFCWILILTSNGKR